MISINLDVSYLLVLGVFVCQLLSISVFVPNWWRDSRTTLINTYPETSFPNLYVHPAQVELKRLLIRKRLDTIAFSLGLLILIFSVFSGLETDQISKNLIYTAIIQLMPFAVSAFWCSRNSHLMSKKFPTKRRTATLANNRMSGLMPIKKICLVLVLFILSILLAIKVQGYLSSDIEAEKIMQLQILNALVLMAMMALGLRILFGVKRDNFASSNEIQLKSTARLQYLLNGLILFNLFIIGIILIKAFGVALLYVMIATSVVVQLVVYTTKDQYFPIEPGVYK